MALTVRPLNADTTFLLTFHNAAVNSDFVVLLDPWLSGSWTFVKPWFQSSHHTVASSIASLAQLERLPDLVIISQDKGDHCNRETLCTLPKDGPSRIIAVPAAAKKIRSWNHFNNDKIQVLTPYSPSDDRTVFRVSISAAGTAGVDGEVTIANIATRTDLTKLHNAIGITYKAPTSTSIPSLLRADSGIDNPEAETDAERAHTIKSVVYTPHGVAETVLERYVQHHLEPMGALPASALFHSMTVESNPWLLGGVVAPGAPAGLRLAEMLKAEHWLSAHDEPKAAAGLSVTWLRTKRYSAREVAALLTERSLETSPHELVPGEDWKLPASNKTP